MSERSGGVADGPFSGRQPTSHERLTGLPWDASYHDGPAPWDVGRPQPAMVRLASDGGFAGAVLDAGCGTGENALYLASLGLSVLGVDVAETALAIARAKAGARGIEVEFAAADAFRLDVRLLLRGIFRAAGGTHDDWDAYDRVMADERRTAVLITPRRVYTNPSAS